MEVKDQRLAKVYLISSFGMVFEILVIYSYILLLIPLVSKNYLIIFYEYLAFIFSLSTKAKAARIL